MKTQTLSSSEPRGIVTAPAFGPRLCPQDQPDHVRTLSSFESRAIPSGPACCGWFPLPREHSRGPGRHSAFTMIEIAISLAVIGFALVAIIGILPFAMNVQRDNRLETIVNQDASVFLNALRNGERGLDDLTNYVMAITNVSQLYLYNGGWRPPHFFGYTRNTSTDNGNATNPLQPMTNGYCILGLLGTPKIIPLSGGFYSNHVVAFVRSLSGPASEKFPQTDPTVQGFALNYRLVCDITGYTTNNFYDPNWVNYQAPGINTNEALARLNYLRYVATVATNLHDVRLTFRWPLLPNGQSGPNYQTYRTTVSGALTNDPPTSRYFFFQPRTFFHG